jgi:hypothetical protein
MDIRKTVSSIIFAKDKTWNNRTNIPLFVGLKLTPSAKDNQ